MNELFKVKVLTTPEYLNVLKNEQKITFAVFVGDKEVHHQISILEFDTREKIEEKMAEIGTQVYEELHSSNNLKRNQPMPQDIAALIEEHKIK